MSRRDGWWNRPRPGRLSPPPPAGAPAASLPVLQLALDPTAAVLLVGLLSLGLKHPAVVGAAGQAGKRVLDHLLDWVLAIPAWEFTLAPDDAVRAEWAHFRRSGELPLKPLQEVARCVECGCTQAQACATPDGPCAWVELGPSPDHALCSACAPQVTS